MKLNLSTNPQTVIATLEREWQMAIDAFKEKHGGAEALDKWQDTLLAKAFTTKKGFIADKMLWVSPDGNKWCVFEDVTYDKASTYTHTCEYAFCYYETIPYAGIFFHIYSLDAEGKKVSGAIIYESHFFERMCERGIMKWEGLGTLIRFISKNHGNLAYCTDVEKMQFDLRMEECIGRGYADRNDNRLIRIKTVLSDEQLSTRQRKNTALGRRVGDSVNKYIDLSFEDNVERMRGRFVQSVQDGTTEDFMQELTRDFARSHGLNTHDAEKLMIYIQSMIGIITAIKPSLTMTTDQQFAIETKAAAWDLMEDIDSHNYDERTQNEHFIQAILRVSKKCNLRITKQSVIKAIYKMRMQAAKK